VGTGDHCSNDDSWGSCTAALCEGPSPSGNAPHTAPDEWYSKEERFGSFEDEDVLDRFKGEPIEFSVTVWIMHNVFDALGAAQQ
jgi:hypothetical protein